MTKKTSFDTTNFDSIDYIIQLPLIDNPKDRQSRFLLAMDYTLSPRDELGAMDTALEHIMHYYDMSKVELIFVEKWQSVCLLIEFGDIPQCTKAYNELFQFFKTIFYVQDLCKLEQIWICAHCNHHNEFSNNTLPMGTTATNYRKHKQQYIYYCHFCNNMNHASINKIKYSYRQPRRQKSQKTKLCAKSHKKQKKLFSTLSPTSSIAPHFFDAAADDVDSLKTPVGHNMFMGHAQGQLKFNLPPKPKPKPKPMIGLSLHEKKHSIDSQQSTISSSTVSSIDSNLDLVCTILENVDRETSSSVMCDEIGDGGGSSKQRIMDKLVKMRAYHKNIQRNIDRLFASIANEDDFGDGSVVIVDGDDQVCYKNHVLTSKNLSLLDQNGMFSDADDDDDDDVEHFRTKSGESLLGIAEGSIKFKSNKYDYD